MIIDLSLGNLANEELSIEIETRDGRKIEGLELESTINGDIQLALNPPKGITSYIKHELRMSASDKYDETTYTDWFTAVFKPKADLVFLTTGNSQIKLGSDDSNFTNHFLPIHIIKECRKYKCLQPVYKTAEDKII